MKILVTGGAGFIGSNVVEYYAKKSFEVTCIDNLSRGKLLKKDISTVVNWDYLSNFKNVKLIKADIRDFEVLKAATKDIDAIVHTAAQTAVTTSIQDPRTDFEVNLSGTFNVLEAARLSNRNPVLIYCSTNKVYGNNVNNVEVREKATRYVFEDKFRNGVPETFSTDLCEHTPYGCSKLAADLYIQDYGHLYGLRSGVFRMSCIYGPHQFGVEDQGWIAWFIIATLLGYTINIYGDGKQVRDVLYVSDLINAYDSFINSGVRQEVFNVGGGPSNTISLIELLNLLEKITGKRSKIRFEDWRQSDQKVYVSNISKISEKLNWVPKISPEIGIRKLTKWISKNRDKFAEIKE
jgi:CDP-paratose 2-epimerase